MDKVAISTGGSMLVCASIIYLGSLAYLYMKLFHPAFSQEAENNNQAIVSSNLGSAGSDEGEHSFDNSDSDGDSSYEYSDENKYESSWEENSRDIETFRKSSNLVENAPQSEHPITTQPGALLPRKYVKFNPISREHWTFSRYEYKRKNDEWCATMEKFRRQPELLQEVYSELWDFIDHEMEVLHQMPCIHSSEQKENGDDFIFETDCIV